VTQRFYRLDKSRHMPGNGLGLSIVSATAKSHDGKLVLEDGAPGLIARIVLPLATNDYRNVTAILRWKAVQFYDELISIRPFTSCTT
jgi:K+-sensing histidine kinase KdpD